MSCWRLDKLSTFIFPHSHALSIKVELAFFPGLTFTKRTSDEKLLDMINTAMQGA